MLDKELVMLSGEEGVQKGVEDGTLGRLLRLSREEDSRRRYLFKRDKLNRVLDKIQCILVFLPKVFWTIVLMPVLILIDKIRDVIKGER